MQTSNCLNQLDWCTLAHNRVQLTMNDETPFERKDPDS